MHSSDKVETIIEVWRSLQPGKRQGECPHCHEVGKAFLSHKRNSGQAALKLVCFNHEALVTYYTSCVEHELVGEMIAAARTFTFPTEASNLVILEIDSSVVVRA